MTSYKDLQADNRNRTRLWGWMIHDQRQEEGVVVSVVSYMEHHISLEEIRKEITNSIHLPRMVDFKCKICHNLLHKILVLTREADQEEET